MIRRDITQLAICQTTEMLDQIPFCCLQKFYYEKPSETIYFTVGNILYGIVCMGEVLHKENGMVKINKAFTVMTGFNMNKAYEIFSKCVRIYKIPVVNAQGELLGDYSRWDDRLYILVNQKKLMKQETVKRILESYNAVYVIEPAENADVNYLQLLEYLNCYQVKFDVLDKEQLQDKLFEKSILIFLNEDERMAVQCLYGIEPYYYDIYGNDVRKYDLLAADTQYMIRMATYKSILVQIEENEQLLRLQITNPYRSSVCALKNRCYGGLDDKAVVLLSALERKGIKCFCLHNFADERTEYGKDFQNGMSRRLAEKNDKKYSAGQWTAKVDKEEFFGELLLQEDYKNETAQNELIYGENAFECKNIEGKYFNAKNRRRRTCYQPKEYVGTIYFIGTCTMIGACVEDQNTIESYLQKTLLDKGYLYRVENCGSMIREDSGIDRRLEEIDCFGENDIVVYQPSGMRMTVGTKRISLEKIFEQYNIPDTWVADGYTHCGHKANKLISDSVFELIEPGLIRSKKDGYNRKVDINIRDIMKDYIRVKYLDYYFPSFQIEKYSTVGAVVVNCSPFHIGHRYLIEQAKKEVAVLIIFVLMDDQSLFSFEERFHLVAEGTKDIENVFVVPSQDFILSKNNFPEHYTKKYVMGTAVNAEYDIDVFADYIADKLHITHRFAGEGAQGRINKVYYDAMRKILPQKGIRFVEIPRLVINGERVCTRQIQKYLEDGEYDKAFSLVPESTKQYLTGLLNLEEWKSRE